MIHRQPNPQLRGVLSECDPRELASVLRGGTEVTVPGGTMIHPPAARLRWAYVLLDGLAIGDTKSGPRYLTAGDAFGLEAVSPEARIGGSLTSLDRVRVLALTRFELLDLLDRSPAFARGVASYCPQTATRAHSVVNDGPSPNTRVPSRGGAGVARARRAGQRTSSAVPAGRRLTPRNAGQ